MSLGFRPEVRRRWMARLAAFRRSGLTICEFCRRECVSEPSFYQWRRRLAALSQPGNAADRPARPGHPASSRAASVAMNERSGKAAEATPAFFPVVLRGAVSRAIVEIALPGGAVVRLLDADRRTLRAAIKAAGSLPVRGDVLPC